VSGYVLIHRKLLKNPVFRDEPEAWAFASLVMQAAWQRTETHYKGRNIVLERGQVCISVRDFANRWGRPQAWAQRFFKRLIEAKMVIQNRYESDTPRDTPPNVLTICNYAKYQATPKDADTGSDTKVIRDRYTEQLRNEGMKEETPSSDGVGTAAPKMPLKAAVDCWNYAAVRCGWQTIAKLSKTREEHLRSRLREHGLDGWKAAIAKAEASEYLAGSTPATWFSFDWLSKPTNFLKVMEGNYDRSRSTPAEAASPTRLAVQRILDRAGR
jgi:hypothetical protein